MLADNVSMPDLAQDELIRTRSRLLARQLLENPPREWRPENVEDQGPMLIIGRHEDVDRWLAARSLPTRPAEVAANRGTAQVWTLQEKSGSVIAVISATDAAALDALQRPLPHYGQQSFLVFEGGRVVSQGTWPARPQQINFARTDQAEAP